MLNMAKKKTSLLAFLFIPVMAFIFAGFFTIIGVIGWKLVKGPSAGRTKEKAALARTDVAVPGKQLAKDKSPRAQLPQPTHSPQPAQAPVSPSQFPTNPRERFFMGLKQCQAHLPEQFPCAWQDTQSGVIKQFKMDKLGEPIVRRVFDMGGRLLNLTSFNTQQGYVIMHRDEQNVNWFFDRSGSVRQIARPSRANTNLQDYYFYTVTGQLNSCVCADKTQTCCADAPDISSSGNHFCELFPLDQEFCSK